MTGWISRRPWWPAGRTRYRAAAAASSLAVLAAVSVAPALAGAVAQRADSPAGFWYGTDSHTVTITGSAPYQEPVIGGPYGGYIGMAGNWAVLTGCHKIVVWSSANSAQANTNHTKYHQGIGTGVYWFMGGPGVDPHYNGTASEAYAWGARQAARALAHAATLHVTYPVVFADIEIPGNAPSYTPAPDNGWNSVYTSPCSGVVRTSFVPANVDRADLNGFAAYVTSHSSDKAGRVLGTGHLGADLRHRQRRLADQHLRMDL